MNFLSSFFEWFSAFLTLLAFWRLGKKTRDGFLWMSAATFSWMIWAIFVSAHAAIIVNLIGTAINIRNWLLWRKRFYSHTQ